MGCKGFGKRSDSTDADWFRTDNHDDVAQIDVLPRRRQSLLSRPLVGEVRRGSDNPSQL